MSIKHTAKILFGLLKYDAIEYYNSFKMLRDISKQHPEISPFNVRGLLEVAYCDASSEISNILATTGKCTDPERELN